MLINFVFLPPLESLFTNIKISTAMDTSAIDPRMMSWEDIKAVLATAALQMQESRQQMQAFIEEADRRSQEADRRSQDADRRSQDADKRSQDADKRSQEADRRSKDADRRSQEAEKRSQETFRKLRELADQFTSTIGHISEGLMAPAAKRIFKQAGFDLNHYYRNLHSKDKNGHAEMEVDLLMLNGSIVIAVEIKTDCRKKDVDHFLRQMPKFKRLFPEFRDKQVLAAVAALNYDKDAAEYAGEQGLLVVRVSENDVFTLEDFNRDQLKRF